jgi:hypothetical protein
VRPTIRADCLPGIDSSADDSSADRQRHSRHEEPLKSFSFGFVFAFIGSLWGDKDSGGQQYSGKYTDNSQSNQKVMHDFSPCTGSAEPVLVRIISAVGEKINTTMILQGGKRVGSLYYFSGIRHIQMQAAEWSAGLAQSTIQQAYPANFLTGINSGADCRQLVFAPAILRPARPGSPIAESR